MTVSFCVIAYNEEKALPPLLNDIRNQDYPHEKMEIVLVNAMSTDNTRIIMEEFAKEDNHFQRVVVIDNPKKIQAAGWNAAITVSTGDIIMRIDGHSVIPSEFVSKNVACIQSGEYVSGGPRPSIAEENSAWNHTLLLAEKSIFGSSIASFRRSHHKSYVKSVFHGAYRREVFEKAGLFNENLGRTEDNEMHYRINQAGYRICYSPNIVSYQYTRSTWYGMIKQKFGNGYWVGLTTGICKDCLSFYHFVPFVFVLMLLACFGLCLYGIRWPLALFGILYGIVSITMSFATVIKEKKHLCYIFLPFIFLSLHIAYGAGTVVGLIKLPFWLKKRKEK